MVIDDLHGIFLGITLSLLYRWFERKNRGKPYFIGSEVFHVKMSSYRFLLRFGNSMQLSISNSVNYLCCMCSGKEN